MNIIIKTRVLSAPLAGTRIRIRIDDPESLAWGMFDLTLADGHDKAVIDWGDGTHEEFAASGKATHTYATTGEYEVRLSDDLEGIRCSYTKTSSPFRSVYAPMIRGFRTTAVRLQTFESSCFNGATNLADFSCASSNVTTLAISAFALCPSLTGRLDFPHAVSIGASAFKDSLGIAELHFGAANEAAIKALPAWTESGGRFGAENAAVFFDL